MAKRSLLSRCPSYFSQSCMYFFPVAQQPNLGLGRLTVAVSRSHTPGKTPLNGWSARRRGRHLHNTQQKDETNRNILNGNRTRESSYKDATDLRLRPHGHLRSDAIRMTYECFRCVARRIFDCTYDKPSSLNGLHIFWHLHQSIQTAIRTSKTFSLSQNPVVQEMVFGEFLTSDSFFVNRWTTQCYYRSHTARNSLSLSVLRTLHNSTKYISLTLYVVRSSSKVS